MWNGKLRLERQTAASVRKMKQGEPSAPLPRMDSKKMGLLRLMGCCKKKNPFLPNSDLPYTKLQERKLVPSNSYLRTGIAVSIP